MTTGTPGNDLLDGGPGVADFIDGGAGADTVTYASSPRPVVVDLAAQSTWDGIVNDTLSSIENAIGSASNDTIQGNSGSNVLDGGAGGADTISGGLGQDTVSYASSTRGVTIDLGAQLTWDGVVNDTLSSIENAIGSAYDDRISGTDGNNLLDGGTGGQDSIFAGKGVDTITYASSARGVTIDLAAETASDGIATDRAAEFENAIGSAFNDTIQGTRGDNVLDGGAGGADTINGGLGQDTVSYASSTRGVTIDLAAQLTWDGLVNDTLSSIETAIGSSFDDILQGTNAAETLDGGTGGADHIFGAGGQDTVTYAHSTRGVVVDLASQLTWDGLSNDTLSSIENANGSAFDDVMQGDAGDNLFDPGTGGADTIRGGDGSDTITYASSTRAMSIDLRAGSTWDGLVNDTLSSIENATGSVFDDTLQGSEGANTLDGGGGTDLVRYVASTRAVTIDLQAQAAFDGFAYDTLLNFERAEGSAFDDIIGGDFNSNILIGGDGNDTVTYASSFRAMVIDLEAQLTWDGGVNDTLVSIENATGSRYNDILTSNSGANRLEGGLGTDTVSYASSRAGVVIDLANQLTWDGSVNDVLVSIENARGSSFDDILRGNAGNNTLDGGAGGSDLIDGSTGTDTVTYASAGGGVTVDLAHGFATHGADTDTLAGIENATGSQFADVFVSGDGANTFDGGAGMDTVSYAASLRAVSVTAGYGRISVSDGVSTDTSTGVEGVTGSSYDDTFFMNPDYSSPDGYTRTVDGGSGSDTVSFANSASNGLNHRITVDLLTGTVSDVTTGATVSATLTNVENVIGSTGGDTIIGDSGDNILDGGLSGSTALAQDLLTGGGGNDTFRFTRGQANGDVINDFDGNGAGQGDLLEFHGYGTRGASLTQVDATHYMINSADRMVSETITLSNAASIHSSDYIFV